MKKYLAIEKDTYRSMSVYCPEFLVADTHEELKSKLLDWQYTNYVVYASEDVDEMISLEHEYNQCCWEPNQDTETRERYAQREDEIEAYLKFFVVY